MSEPAEQHGAVEHGAVEHGAVQHGAAEIPAPMDVPCLVVGEVEQGDQRGRTLGIPTANVAIERRPSFPDEGVYAGVVKLPDGTRHKAAVSLGRRPTFYAEGFELCEAHLLDFDGDLYGQVIEVQLTHRIRGQVRFDGVDALIARMRQDCDIARAAITNLD